MSYRGRREDEWRREKGIRYDSERFWEDPEVQCVCRNCGHKTKIYTAQRNKKGPFVCPKCRLLTLHGFP